MFSVDAYDKGHKNQNKNSDSTRTKIGKKWKSVFTIKIKTKNKNLPSKQLFWIPPDTLWQDAFWTLKISERSSVQLEEFRKISHS